MSGSNSELNLNDLGRESAFREKALSGMIGCVEVFRAPSSQWAGNLVFRPVRRIPRCDGPLTYLRPEHMLSQVLLVDDNPVQLQVREMILRNAGFSVAIATSAETALVLLRTANQHIGLVITDHIMPGTSGAEFVRRLRASGDQMPVIVLSGLPDAEQEYRDFDVIFRMKPLPPLELIELARRFKRAENAA